ncbi:hypothetical protein D3C85_1338390 [compost metagenome]
MINKQITNIEKNIKPRGLPLNGFFGFGDSVNFIRPQNMLPMNKPSKPAMKIVHGTDLSYASVINQGKFISPSKLYIAYAKIKIVAGFKCFVDLLSSIFFISRFF